MVELKNQQQPLSIDGQIKNLKELGLIISDEEYAKRFLNDVSYFRLVKAFSLSFKPKNKQYSGDVTFEHLVQLYLFNANFRQILFSEIEKVEINLRCRIANYFSCKYGVLGYEDANNFDNSVYHNHFLNEIQIEINRNLKTPFVKNFSQKYVNGAIPFYALVELFSFGTLSKFYKNLKSEDKKAIALTYGIGYTYFESWIESISFVRNVCAHYGRLYNAKLSKTPILYKQYTKDDIGNIRVFAIVLCMKHILYEDKHWVQFVDVLEALFDKYEKVDKFLMGFPENWKEYLI